MSKPLTELEERFCLKYFENGGVGRQAVLEAGYNQTEKAAAVTSTRLLKKANIQARLAELRKKQEKRTEITADRVLKELGRVAFFDLGRAYDDKGNLLNIKDMPKGVRRAIAGIKVFEEFDGFGDNRHKVGEVREIKTVDKVRALQLIGQHLKMFTEKHEHTGADGKPIEFKSNVPDAELDARIQVLLERQRKAKGE